MDARELRIGNLIKFGDRIAPVSIIEMFEGTNAINELNQDMIDPVPLTEERLKKFGFIKGVGIWSHVKNIHLGLTRDGYYLEHHTTFIPDVEFKYAHQLQNLFHTLTGKELELKELA